MSGGLGDANFRLASMTAGTLLNFSYQYDKVGNVTQITDTAVTPNDTQGFTYDHLGRLLTATGTQPAYNHTYTYNLTSGQALGNISNRTESGTVYSYVYSSSQRQAVTQLWQGLNQIGAYGYDANGNMTTRNDNEGNFTQVFDVENRLVSVTNNVVEEVTTFTYDANGQRVKTIKPDGTVMYSPFPFYEEYVPTLQTTVLQPDASGEDAYVYNGQPSTNYGSSTALVVGYEDVDTYFWRSFLRFDLSAVPAGAAVTEATLTLVCAYTLGSDLYATLNLYPASATWAENSVTWANQPGRNATPIANDKIDNASYVAYDFTVTDFVQDWLAGTTANHGFRLEVTQTAAASGKVNCRSSDYATASLRPKLTVSWYPQETPFVRSYYSLGGQTIALRKVGGDSPGLYYVYADYLGSTQRLSTSTGSPVLGSDARFLPFGKYRIVPTAGLTDRGFTGHLHNDPIGLVYMNARYYAPSIGRFASADTIVPDPTNPQAYNRYGYALNNPLRYTDPTGHWVDEKGGNSGGAPCPDGLQGTVCGALYLGALGASYAAEDPAMQQLTEALCGLSDPCDAANTARRIAEGEDVGVLEMLGAGTPLVPAIIGRWGDDLLSLGAKYWDEAADAARFSANNWREAERIMSEVLGMPKNTARYYVEGMTTYRVPDFVTDTYIADSKFYGLTTLTDSDQLRDFAVLAREQEKPLFLFVREGTRVTNSVYELVRATGGDVLRVYKGP